MPPLRRLVVVMAIACLLYKQATATAEVEVIQDDVAVEVAEGRRGGGGRLRGSSWSFYGWTPANRAGNSEDDELEDDELGEDNYVSALDNSRDFTQGQLQLTVEDAQGRRGGGGATPKDEGRKASTNLPIDEGIASSDFPKNSMNSTKNTTKKNNKEDRKQEQKASTKSQKTPCSKGGSQGPSPSPSLPGRTSTNKAALRALDSVSREVAKASKEAKSLNSTAAIKRRGSIVKGRKPVTTRTSKDAFKALNKVDKELNNAETIAKNSDKKTKLLKKAMNATKQAAKMAAKKEPKPCTSESCQVEGYRPLAYEMVQKMKAEEPQAWVPGMQYSKTVLENLQSILPPEYKKDECWQKEKALVIDFVKGTTIYDKSGGKVDPETLFEKPEDESSVAFTIKGKLFQSKDAKDNCEMEARVSAQACPPTYQKTGGRKQVRECEKCTRGYLLANVDTTLKQGKNNKECKQWFVYADTVVRNAFDLFSSADIAQRVDKCLDKGLDLGRKLGSSIESAFGPKSVAVAQKPQNISGITSLLPGYTPKAYEMLQLLVKGGSGPSYSTFMVDKIKQKVLLPAWQAGPGQQSTNRECWVTNKTYAPLVIQIGDATIFDSNKNKVDPGELIKKPASESYVTLTVKGKIFQQPEPPCLMAEQQCSMKVRVSAQACPASKHNPTSTCSGGGGDSTLGDAAEDHKKDDKDTKKDKNDSKGQEKKKGTECKVCYQGYMMTNVQTTLVEGEGAASCASWFTYADAVFRTAFSTVSSAEIAGLVQKCQYQ